MNRGEREVVSAVIKGLKARIGPERFQLWFSSGVQFSVRDGQLVVAAADQFVLDRVKKQFAVDIRAAAAECGPGIELSYEIDPSLRACRPAVKPARESCPPPETPAAPAKKPPRRKFARLATFVVADGNRVAHSAAESVSRQPGRFSPLFVYGPAGCGKTHLLEGIWSHLRGQALRSRVLYLSAEQFTSFFLEALRGGGLPSFRRKCRAVDLLVIDDVHFFAGKKATIIELQHTVDTLMRSGKQLVLAADRPPSMLRELGSELIARFSGGLICGIDKPDYATRLGIAKRFAHQLQIAVPSDVLEMVAAEMSGDARQIAGALNRLEATCLALHQTLSMPLARTTLQEVCRATQRVVRLPDIERAVCDTFGLDPSCLRERSKAKAVSHPRMLAMWLARKYTHAAFSEISQYFGRRSHSTVISAEKKVARLVADGSSVQLGQEACRVQDAIRRIECKLRTG